MQLKMIREQYDISQENSKNSKDVYMLKIHANLVQVKLVSPNIYSMINYRQTAKSHGGLQIEET